MDSKQFTICYCRVSTREQADEGYGLDAQESKCREYIKLYGYEEEVKIYRDEGFSAKNMKRPMLQKMLDDVEKGAVKRVIIYKLDRLSRRVVDTYKIINMINEAKCQLISVMDRLDITTSNGKMVLGILSVIAEWEQNVISERTLDGLAAKASKNQYPFSRVPFGWDKDEDGYLSVNKREAEIVNKIVDLYLEGENLLSISTYLEENYQLHMNSLNSIKDLVKRDINAGIFKYRGKDYPGIFPPIIDAQRHEMAMDAYTHRQINDPERHKYLFHSKVYCMCGELCEQSSTIKKTNNKPFKYFYYVCPSCRRRVNQDRLLSSVSVLLLEHLNREEKTEDISLIHAELEQLEERAQGLADRYFSQEVQEDIYLFSMKEYQKKRTALENEIKVLEMIDAREFFNLEWRERKNLIDRYISSVTYDMVSKVLVKIKFKR
ncbi:MAG: recombinase family protein [Holdemanella sp.]|nr:recombinase family protein [Holdemanella sp.]